MGSVLFYGFFCFLNTILAILYLVAFLGMSSGSFFIRVLCLVGAVACLVGAVAALYGTIDAIQEL